MKHAALLRDFFLVEFVLKLTTFCCLKVEVLTFALESYKRSKNQIKAR